MPASVNAPARITRVRRTDLSTLQPVERRDDGTVLVDARLTKCGVFTYLQPDGSIRRELRRREDVCAPASLRTLIGRPVTNNHPPGLLDAKSARDWAVGAQAGDVTIDEDHVRSKLGVWDASTIGAMEAGKVQVSCGYECDCLETPGEHPVYGRYDAIQTGIKYNHIAIVDHGRAGPTAAVRMDGWMVAEPGPARGPAAPGGTTLARTPIACNPRSMAKRKRAARRADDGSPDPNDEASRNAAGDNDATKAPKVGEEHQDADCPKCGAEIEGDPDKCPKCGARLDDDDDSDEETAMDAYDVSCDDDGTLTDAARDRMKAKNFAVPDQEKLPIHDPDHVKAAMSRFGQTQFADPDEKHAAFNRIVGRAKEFGMSSTNFQRAHGAKLDRAAGPRSDTSMTPEQIKKLQDRADKSDARKKARDEHKARADAAETKVKELEGQLAKAQGDLTSAQRDLETAKKGHLDSAAIDKLVAERGLLVATAAQLGVPKFDSLDKPEIAAEIGAMPAVAIKRAVIKHVDKEDVPADRHPEFVEALYQGALKRGRKDAADKAAGAAAINAARGAGGANTAPVVTDQPGTRSDARPKLPTEAEAKERMRNDSLNSWTARSGNAATLRGSN